MLTEYNGYILETSYEEFFSDVFLERWVVFITFLFPPFHMTNDLSIHERIYCSNIYEREYGDTFLLFFFFFSPSFHSANCKESSLGLHVPLSFVIPCSYQTWISPLCSFYFLYFRLGGGVTVLSDQGNRNLNNIGFHRVFLCAQNHICVYLSLTRGY